MSKAKPLTTEQYAAVRQFVENSSARVERDLVALSLSFRAGLRVAEIAGMTWRNVLTVEGKIVAPEKDFEVPCNIAKKGSGRTVPMHRELYDDLVRLRVTKGRALTKGTTPVILNDSGDAMLPNSLQRYLGRMYEACGFYGVSSHSGRRTFITSLARVANEHGCSLYDVQKIAGHSDISTTAEYIDNSDRIGKLVNAL